MMEEVYLGWRKLHNAELRSFYHLLTSYYKKDFEMGDSCVTHGRDGNYIYRGRKLSEDKHVDERKTLN
jgi:hypothetical protein